MPRALLLLAFAVLVAPFAAPGNDRNSAVKEPTGYWTGPINSAVPATITGGQVIHARELADFVKRNAAVVVDVSNAPKRPEGMSADAPWLPLPHEAIPGSTWIAGAGMGEIAKDVEVRFRDYLSRQTGHNQDHPVVIYCHEQCWLSWNAAKRAINYGYRHVYWFAEGIEGWRAAGLSTQVIPESTADVIAINVLLEPDASMVATAKALNERLRTNDPQGFALDETHVAHISLLHRYVQTRDLDKVYAAVDRIVAQDLPQRWSLKATGYETASWQDRTITSIVVQPSEPLSMLQSALVTALAPYAVPQGNEQAFVTTADSPHIDAKTIDYVASFVPKNTGEHFKPHITAGLSDAGFAKQLQVTPFEPMTFHAANVAVYQLGNVGTARKKLHVATGTP